MSEDRATSTPPRLFDRRAIRRRRARGAVQFTERDFLHRRAAEDVIDRLGAVTRRFPAALVIGAGPQTAAIARAAGAQATFASDCALARLPDRRQASRLIADDDGAPYVEASLDLIVSILTLHTANDLIGALAQLRLALKPDGLLIAALFAEGTLGGLRDALQTAESERARGVAPRFAPMASVQDLGSALGRAGFAMPVVDIDRVRVAYRSPMSLIADIRAMGESAPLAIGAPPLRRDVALDALARFAANGEERFDIAYLTGWAPHPAQPKARPRGSATHSLASAVKSAGTS